jgi:hypothetical protein
MDYEAKYKSQKRKRAYNEAGPDEDKDEIGHALGNAQGPTVALPQFLQKVGEAADVNNNSFDLSMRVDCSMAISKDFDALAKAYDVARVMEKATLWHWTYVDMLITRPLMLLTFVHSIGNFPKSFYGHIRQYNLYYSRTCHNPYPSGDTKSYGLLEVWVMGGFPR